MSLTIFCACSYDFRYITLICLPSKSWSSSCSSIFTMTPFDSKCQNLKNNTSAYFCDSSQRFRDIHIWKVVGVRERRDTAAAESLMVGRLQGPSRWSHEKEKWWISKSTWLILTILGQTEGNFNAHTKSWRHYRKVTRKMCGKCFENFNWLWNFQFSM